MIPENIWRLMSPADQERYGKGQLSQEQALERFCASEEKELQRRFKSWLDLRELDYCNPRMDRKSTVQIGQSDFIVWQGNRICLVEFKSEHGRLSPAQTSFIERQRARGTPVLVSYTFEEARDFVIATLELEPLPL